MVAARPDIYSKLIFKTVGRRSRDSLGPEGEEYSNCFDIFSK